MSEDTAMAIGVIVIILVIIMFFMMEAENGWDNGDDGHTTKRYYVSCSSCKGPKPAYSYSGYDYGTCDYYYDICLYYECQKINYNC